MRTFFASLLFASNCFASFCCFVLNRFFSTIFSFVSFPIAPRAMLDSVNFVPAISCRVDKSGVSATPSFSFIHVYSCTHTLAIVHSSFLAKGHRGHRGCAWGRRGPLVKVGLIVCGLLEQRRCSRRSVPASQLLRTHIPSNRGAGDR
jgi:hypothetical protein